MNIDTKKVQEDRLDAWFDGSAICVIAVGSHGDPMDLGEAEVEALIEKLSECLRQARAANGQMPERCDVRC